MKSQAMKRSGHFPGSGRTSPGVQKAPNSEVPGDGCAARFILYFRR
jgi:hypothetical protein